MARGRRWLAAAIVAAAGTACAGGGEAARDYEVIREIRGDTTVVRTLSGSVWGAAARLVPELSIGELDGDAEYLFGRIESIAVGPDGTIYVVDGQVPELRAYGPDGVFRAILGGPGQGPGELGQPDAGLAVLSDGRVLVRDPGNARIQVYSARGEPLGTWPARGGLFTSTPFMQTAADEVHATIWLNRDAGIDNMQSALVRYGPDGIPGDTLVPPDRGYDAPTLEWRSDDGGASMRRGVPFSPREDWAVHVDGYFVHGVATEYWIDLLKPDGPVRIERMYEPVPVAQGERAEEEASATRAMRSMAPSWQWNGPRIPSVKPPFRGIHAGRDGRIWVHVHERAVEVADPGYDPRDPDAVEDRWREPVAFDVFESDGTYLGRVAAPMDFRMFPTPVFDATHVWAATRDDLEVQRVVRYRIEVPETR